MKSDTISQPSLVDNLARNQAMVASIARTARERHLIEDCPHREPFRPDVRPRGPVTGDWIAPPERPRLDTGAVGVPSGQEAAPNLLEDIKQVVGDAMKGVAESVTSLARTLEAQHSQASRQLTRRRLPPAASSEDDTDVRSVRSSRFSERPHGNPRLPPFTGKEKWEVWFTRFTEVASLNHWTEHQRLQELLPRLQGPAGDFVYAQLPSEVRSSYGRLVRELNSRFRVVETRKTFGAQFSNRNQKPGETVEEFAAELKRLYTKAYPSRYEATRNEDLLRRFLDGLYDERARFHIEFVKEPDCIDQAVYEVINFQETRRRPAAKEGPVKSRPTRAVKCYESSDEDQDMVQPDSSDEDSQEERVARIPSRSGKARKIRRPDQTATKESTRDSSKAVTPQSIEKLMEEVEKLKLQLTASDSARGTDRQTETGKARSLGDKEEYQSRRRNRDDMKCFKCGESGHMARRCPKFKWVQVPTQDTPSGTGVTSNNDTSSSPVQRNNDFTFPPQSN